MHVLSSSHHKRSYLRLKARSLAMWRAFSRSPNAGPPRTLVDSSETLGASEGFLKWVSP